MWLQASDSLCNQPSMVITDLCFVKSEVDRAKV